MSTDQAMATDAANPLTSMRGSAKHNKSKTGNEAQAFGALLDKAAMRTGQRQAAKAERDMPLRVAEATDEIIDDAQAPALPEQTDPEDSVAAEDDEAVSRDLPRSDTATVRLTALFGAILPGTVHKQHDSAETPSPTPVGQKPAVDKRSALAKARHEILSGEASPEAAEWQPSEAAAPVAVSAALLRPETATHERKPARVAAETSEPEAAAIIIVAGASASPEAARPAEGKGREPVAVLKLESVTVTKVETAFVPFAVSGGQQGITHSPLKETSSASPLAPSFVALPEQTMVKTIELRLQPEDLGELKIAIHLRGDELRLQVEVSTHEAHALLLRDKSALSQVLEKAGYDLAESSVTLTLRPEALPPAAATSSSGNDASSSQRGGSGASFQQQTNEQQSRQSARQPYREEPHARSTESPSRLAVRPNSGDGIYL